MISDHKPIFILYITTSVSILKSLLTTVLFREILCDSLDNSIWECILRCHGVDTVNDNFITLFTDNLNQLCPTSKIKINIKLMKNQDVYVCNIIG